MFLNWECPAIRSSSARSWSNYAGAIFFLLG
jgi:hypothetical protein